MATVSTIRAAVVLLLLTHPAAADPGDGGWERVEGKGQPSANGKPPQEQTTPVPAPAPAPAPAAQQSAAVELEPEPEPAEDASDGKGDDEESARGPTTAELLLQVDKTEFDIPITYNKEVIEWIEFFCGPGRGTMRRWMARSGRYKNLIQGELIKARLPADIFYLAMIESGFSPYATSHAEAVGVWQFIAPTAKTYGLRVDEHIDERKDTLRATGAAIAYLSKLKIDFGNWYMAFASYNAGEGLVFSVIRSYGSLDYWGLGRAGALPEETRNYVPKMLAAATIAKNPELFGFTGIDYERPIALDAVEVNANTSVADLARSARMDEADFRDLNPHILGDKLPGEPLKQAIYLPRGSEREFLAALSGTQYISRTSGGHRVPVAPEPAPDLSHHGRSLLHTVSADDTATSIAEWYHISEADLRSWNGLGADDDLSVGQELRTTAPRAARWTSYTTRSGETLASVARKHGCSVADLRSWNGLEDDVSRPDPGTVLWLHVP